MILAPSKSLSHVRDALMKMEESSIFYGHPRTRLFYTDSASVEEQALLNIFSAMRESILRHESETAEADAPSPPSTPADSAASTSNPTPLPRARPEFKLPAEVKQNVIYARTEQEINDAAQVVIDDFLRGEPEGRHVVIGFDAEWSSGWVRGRKKPLEVSVIQWAYKKMICVAQVPFSIQHFFRICILR